MRKVGEAGSTLTWCLAIACPADSGGEKVAPIEVESILMEMPAIADCLVYAEENAITGQIVVAQIVPQGEYETVQLKRAIKKHCRKRLATYKIPARIQITEKTKYSDRLKKLRSQ